MLLNVRTHLQGGAHGCENYPTLEKVFKALCSKYWLSVREARMRQRDTKLSLTDHATEVKKLVEVAYADLPRNHKEEVTLNLGNNAIYNNKLSSGLPAS